MILFPFFRGLPPLPAGNPVAPAIIRWEEVPTLSFPCPKSADFCGQVIFSFLPLWWYCTPSFRGVQSKEMVTGCCRRLHFDLVRKFLPFWLPNTTRLVGWEFRKISTKHALRKGASCVETCRVSVQGNPLELPCVAVCSSTALL